MSENASRVREWLFTPLFDQEASGTFREHEDLMGALGYVEAEDQ